MEIKKGLSGDLKIDSKTMNPPAKVEKLRADISNYIKQKSDPRILAAKPGEFVQPKGQGFSIGKVKNKRHHKCRQIIQGKGDPHKRDQRAIQPCDKPDDEKQSRAKHQWPPPIRPSRAGYAARCPGRRWPRRPAACPARWPVRGNPWC